MSVLEIHKYPSRVLKQTAKDVAAISDRTARMLHDMVDTMYIANGIGLAAPQIGVLERVIVVDIDPDNRGKNLLKIINPVIVESSGSIVWEEGCLSVVNYTAEVTRAQHVLVRGWTLDEKEVEIEASDLEAVCLQHEIDHLEGTLFIDHVSRLKRELYRKRLRKENPELVASAGSGTGTLF
jgi:peptide deformylase